MLHNTESLSLGFIDKRKYLPNLKTPQTHFENMKASFNKQVS